MQLDQIKSCSDGARCSLRKVFNDSVNLFDDHRLGLIETDVRELSTKVETKIDALDSKFTGKLDELRHESNDKLDTHEFKFEGKFNLLIGLMLTSWLSMMAPCSSNCPNAITSSAVATCCAP